MIDYISFRLFERNATATAAQGRQVCAASNTRLRHLNMRKGRVIQIDTMPHPLRITCHSGTVWVSQTGAPKIVVLGAGDSFKPRPDGWLIIHALEPACVAQSPEADDIGGLGEP